MLKKILKPIRKQLLKFDCVKRAVLDYRLRQNAAQLMYTGQTVRDVLPIKPEPDDTLRIVENDGLFVDYLGGNVVGQGYVNPVFIDSCNWGVGEWNA